MGFQQGLSGLNVSAKQLDVIGNNIANANTVGFKMGQAQFADVYAASLSGAGGNQVGLGARLAAVAQQFTQGNITVTNSTMDMAINGQGFYRMDNNGAVSYSRNGQFQIDQNGFMVNSQGAKLTGFQVNPATGAIVAATPSPLQIPTANMAAKPSANVSMVANLDARSAVPITAAFSPTVPTSFNNSTAVTTYDSLGNSHVSTLYFQLQAVNPAAVPPVAANTWNVYATVDGVQVPAVVAPAAATPVGTLVFNTNGTLATPVGGTMTTAPFSSVGATPNQTLTFNFTNSTQFGANFGVNSLTQDGYGSGLLSGFSTAADGTVMGRYSNGQSKVLGQVVLANFANPQGLVALGGNGWAQSPTSGSPLVGAPGTAQLGAIQSGAVEDSNTDLTGELVNMITAQRVYQANAQTIKTQDQILQTLVNMR
jgi:flagellar hook protein FlgE